MENMTEQEEKMLYGKAQRRVRFKVHVMIYILTNAILWLLLYFGFKLFGVDFNVENTAFQFILFISLTWGVFVVAHYLIVYKWGRTWVEKEFNKIKEDHKRKKKALEDKSVNNLDSQTYKY